MKAYHKRLLTLVVAAALVLALSSVFISAVFAVDASQLRLHPEGSARSAENLNRSDGTPPTRAQINADGYDTVLTDGFDEVLSDARARLYFNEQTAEIALLDIITGQVWYSNPQDRAQETLVEGTTRLRLGAQVTVTYFDQKGAFGQMDTYNDCMAYGSMTWEMADGENGPELHVRYRLGKTTVTLADVPQQISVSRMERFIEPLDEASRADLLKNYRIASVTGQDVSYIEKIQKKYPNVVNEDVYYLTKDSTRILTKIRGYLDQCGYTYDDLDYDNAENQVETEATSRAHFAFTICYRLEDGSLVASLLGDSLAYDEAIPPYEIRFLEYFGAGGAMEKGYLFLPDGSGTLIYYNNGKAEETPFSMRLYGEDTISGTESAYIADQKASLPVFGIKNGKAALLAEVEEGAALCSLNARVAGMQNSYNTAFVSYMATAVDRVTLSDAQRIYFESRPYRGHVTVRFTPLAENDSDYMGMARVYRARLLASGLLREEQTSVYPLMADIICAVPNKQIVAGLTIPGIEAMTTYAQAADIARALQTASSDVCLRLEGWMRAGMDQEALTGLYPQNALGGQSALTELIAASQSEGFRLLPQAYLQTALRMGGFSTSSDCVRDLSRDIAVRYEYDYLNRYRRYNNRLVYQLNAARTARAGDALTSGAAGLGLSAAAIADVGTALYSDYNIENPMNRVRMQSAQEDTLPALSQALSLALPNPNAYALPYASLLYDLPTGDSGFRVTDESVPFYQAVVRGSLPYVAPSINYADDYNAALLAAVEYGAGLQYTLCWQNTALLKDTAYSHLNKGCFADWQTTLLADAARVSAAMAPLAGLEMIDHERAAFNLYVTTYADGTRVAVNYGMEDQWIDGVRVPARNFAVIKAGEDT